MFICCHGFDSSWCLNSSILGECPNKRTSHYGYKACPGWRVGSQKWGAHRQTDQDGNSRGSCRWGPWVTRTHPTHTPCGASPRGEGERSGTIPSHTHCWPSPWEQAPEPIRGLQGCRRSDRFIKCDRQRPMSTNRSQHSVHCVAGFL